MAMTSIRKATRDDLPAIGRLGALLVATHHDFDESRFMAATPQTEHGYASFLGTQLDKPNIIVLVGEENGTVIGYVYAGLEGTDYMSLRGPAGVLYDIVVDPSARRKGVGRRLLDAIVMELESKGAPQIVLATAQKNESAQRLFEGSGFRRTMIEMTRDLDGDAP